VITDVLPAGIPADRLLGRAGLPRHEADRLREPARRLTDSLRTDSRPNLIGRLAARRHMAELAANLARLLRWREETPAIAQAAISQPLIITGLPRTGSTLLHMLLAQDPDNRAPLTWEVMSPPAPDARDERPHVAAAARRLALAYRLAPGFRAIHPMAPRLPQECIAIMAPGFRSIEFHTTHDVASYQDWLERDGHADAYRVHQLFLQHLHYRGPRGRWVLKAPGHMFSLPELTGQYPDALIVQTHRDPVKVAGSLANHTTTLRRAFSRRTDPAAIAHDWLERWWRALDATLDWRDTSGRPVLDIHYEALTRDPLAAVGRLYEQLGWRYTDRARRAMRIFLEDQARESRGRHRYRLQDFDLRAGEIRRRTADYRQCFAITTEA